MKTELIIILLILLIRPTSVICQESFSDIKVPLQWQNYESHPVREAYLDAISITPIESSIIYHTLKDDTVKLNDLRKWYGQGHLGNNNYMDPRAGYGEYSRDENSSNALLIHGIAEYFSAENEFERRRLESTVIEKLSKWRDRIMQLPYMIFRQDIQLHEYSFEQDGFPYSYNFPISLQQWRLARGLRWTTFFHLSIENQSEKEIFPDVLSMSADSAQVFVNNYPDRKLSAYFVYRPYSASEVNRKQYLNINVKAVIFVTPDNKVIGIYPDSHTFETNKQKSDVLQLLASERRTLSGTAVYPQHTGRYRYTTIMKFIEFDVASNKFVAQMEFPSLGQTTVKLEGRIQDIALTGTETEFLKSSQQYRLGYKWSLQIIDATTLTGRFVHPTRERLEHGVVKLEVQ